jgi:hypothetical protein
LGLEPEEAISGEGVGFLALAFLSGIGMAVQITKQSVETVYFDTDNLADLPPLSPFMIHLWRLYSRDVDEATLHDPARREAFIYWFYDTVHRMRAPYRWPVPQRTLDWSNAPAMELKFSEPPLMGWKSFLSRFLAHVWRHYKQEFDVSKVQGFLAFVSWFAFDCIPAWNLPRGLLPDHLITILNKPVADESVPLTLAMLARTEGWQQLLGSLEKLDRPTALALSFQALPEVLRLGDPRLIPGYVSSFWLGRPDPGVELTAYEYLLVRSGAPGMDPSSPLDSRNVPAAREWSRIQTNACPPNSQVFTSAGCTWPLTGESVQDLQPLRKAIYTYRDRSTPCGQGRASKAAFEALAAGKIPVLDIEFSLPRNRMEEEFKNNENRLRQAESAIHIMNLNPEYVPECLLLHLSRLREGDRLIGQFFWELSDIGSTHGCGLSLIDEIWVATEYLKTIYTSRTTVPVFVMGQAVEPYPAPTALSRAALGLPPDSYIFLYSFDAGSGLLRKHPLAAVRAFRRAFPTGSEKAALVLKTMNTNSLTGDEERREWQTVMEIASEDPRVVIIDRLFSEAELASLYELSDCYVSLHRSEGFGYGPAEALARGKPVIVTNYSGPTDFCTAETAMLVDYELCQVRQGLYPYMDPDRSYFWASPEIEIASQHMRTVYANPEYGFRLGANGRRLMAEQYSVAALAGRYSARLKALGFWEEAGK